LTEQEQCGPAEDDRQADTVEGLVEVGDEQVVSCRRGDDAGDDQKVDVGVCVARDPAGILAAGDGRVCVLRRAAEIEPPQRNGVQERKHEADHDGKRQAVVGGGCSRHDDRLAERDR